MLAPTDVTISDGSVTKIYLIDRGGDYFKGYWHHDSIPTLRPQQDNSASPSERSINPEIGWLRSFESWHHGAGQSQYDRADSDQYRFRSSKGINPWTKWQATLLNTTRQIRSNNGGAIGSVLAAGSKLYHIDGAPDAVYYTSDITVGSPTWTAATGLGTGKTMLATDGTTLWCGHNTAGGALRSTTAGGTAFAAYATGNRADVVGFAKGRLMVADFAGNIFNITAAGAFPAALATFPYVSWLGFAEGASVIYVAGNAATAHGAGGVVYRIGIKQDGTGLTAPVPASPGMPRGELINSIGNYVGLIFLCTTKGIRMCSADSNGDLTIGPPIVIPGGTISSFGDDRFVYFGWPTLDAGSGGLGRMDLSAFVDTLLPAYASDLQVPSGVIVTPGGIGGIDNFQNLLVFGVNTLATADTGVWCQDTNLVTSAQILSGYITYNISDPKSPNRMSANVRSVPATGSGLIELSRDDGAYATALSIPGSSNGTIAAQITGVTTAERMELRTTLTSASDHLTGPTLTRETLLSEVIVATGFYLNIPVILAESQLEHGGGAFSTNVKDERAQLVTWRTNRTSLTLTIGTESYAGVIRELKDTPDKQTDDALSFDSGMIVVFKTNPS